MPRYKATVTVAEEVRPIVVGPFFADNEEQAGTWACMAVADRRGELDPAYTAKVKEVDQDQMEMFV